MIAVLPMYDWPEVRGATDRLWAALRDGFRAEGLPAPEALARDIDAAAAWLDPGLILGQTCGLPLVRGLRGRVTVLGALDFGLPGCAPGWYRSAFVVRADDPRETLGAFRGARFALNGTDSQSGYGAMLRHVAPLAVAGRFFATAEVTGAHVVSAARVAAGAADIAAIDYVSWRLFRRFRPEAAKLRVLMLSDPTPGLPLIAAPGLVGPRHRAVIARAVEGLDADSRRDLGLRGFAPLGVEDYAVIDARARAAEALVSL